MGLWFMVHPKSTNLMGKVMIKASVLGFHNLNQVAGKGGSNNFAASCFSTPRGRVPQWNTGHSDCQMMCFEQTMTKSPLFCPFPTLYEKPNPRKPWVFVQTLVGNKFFHLVVSTYLMPLPERPSDGQRSKVSSLDEAVLSRLFQTCRNQFGKSHL